MPYTDEYLDTKKKMMASAEREQNAQDTLDNERAMGRLAPRSKERSPEQVIADQQQEALALVRARPEYKKEFSDQLSHFKQMDDRRKQYGIRNLEPLRIAEKEFGREPWYDPADQVSSDQRRRMDGDAEGREANLDDAYAQAVGDLIGRRYDRDALSDAMSSAASGLGLFSPFGIKTPDVYANEAHPDAVRRLARLEAYFEGSPAYRSSGAVNPERPSWPIGFSWYAPETRQDYETPRIKMLEPQKK